MKRLRLPLSISWRAVAGTGAAAALAAAALLMRLTTLVPRLSPGEVNTMTAAASWHAIVNNPLGLPLKLLERLAGLALPHQPLWAARLPSVALGGLALGIAVYILRRWYGRRSLVFGFALLLSSAWFLHVSRYAGMDALYLTATLALMAVHIGLYDNVDHWPMAFVWLAAKLLLLFIPGFVWLVAISLVLQRREIITAWRSMRSWIARGSWLTLAAVGCAALATSLIRTAGLWRTWLGLPTPWPAWPALGHQAVAAVSAYVWHGPHEPARWLDTLPLLDAFAIAMLLAGIIFYARHWRAARTHVLLAYLVAGLALTALGGPVSLSIAVPILYLVIVAGIAYALYFWLQRFPRNGLARAAGIALVTVVLLLSCTYNLEQYFVAWPHSPETAAAYRQNTP